MDYFVEMGSGAVTYIPNFIKIGLGIVGGVDTDNSKVIS
jgi:hypothetical protein